jgi:hypothetical protein
MKVTLQIAALTVLFITACAPQQRAQPPAPVIGRQVDTEAEAVAVVLADVQCRGGDPRKEECSAKLMDGNWHVVAWHIWYPNNTGSSRFVPGGFTVYVVSTDGRIIKTLPGE